MPRGRKPKPKDQTSDPVVKKKRGRPKKIVDPPPLPPVSEPAKVVEPVVVAPKKKVEPPKPAPAPIDPEQQKLIDKYNAETKKKIDEAVKDATPDNIIQKIFEALGPSTDW